jgi:hypothetical protein
MDDEALRKLTGISQADQADAGMGNQARIYAGFYCCMVANGIPEALAAEMLRDLNYLQWYRALWPNAPPPFFLRGGDE